MGFWSIWCMEILNIILKRTYYNLFKNEGEVLPVSIFLKLLTETFDEMLESLRNYSNLSADP